VEAEDPWQIGSDAPKLAVQEKENYMSKSVARGVVVFFVLCLAMFVVSSTASASSVGVNNAGGHKTSGPSNHATLQGFGSGSSSPADVNVNVPFPTAGDAYCSFTNGCGTIPSGGQTAYQWTAGDYVLSSVFTGTGITSATDLTADWIFQDYLGTPDGSGQSTQQWNVYVNGVEVAYTILPDCNYCGSYYTVGGGVTFSDIAPVDGGYQIALVLQNTTPDQWGSVAWADGGITGLSGTATPEPSALMLLGTGLVGLAGAVRRKLS
jgi:hypothetical protein